MLNPDGRLVIPTFEVFEPLLGDGRYLGAHGGRGSGKSHFFAEKLVECAVSRPGLRWVCIRETQRSLKESSKRLVEDKILELGVGHLFGVTKQDIRTPGGGLILFQGMQNHTAESIKSLEGYDGAWVEEAQTLSQRSLDLLRPTIRKPGSELWFSWNPNKPTDAVDRLLRGKETPPGAIVVEANYTDNPKFPDVLRAECEYDMAQDHEKWLHVWRGQYWSRSKSQVFKRWRIEEFEVDPEAVIRQGADFGFSVDPSVLVQCYTTGQTMFVPYEASRVGCEIVDLPELFLSVPGAEKWPLVADSARPETISHLRRNGFPKIRAAVKGARSLEEGVEWLQSFEIVVHPRCKRTIAELQSYRYKVDPDTDEVLPLLEDKDNHVIDALRYANEGARRLRKSTFAGSVKINKFNPMRARA